MPSLSAKLSGIRDARGKLIKFNRNAGVSEYASRPSNAEWIGELTRRERTFFIAVVPVPLVFLIILALLNAQLGREAWFQYALSGWAVLVMPRGLNSLMRASNQAHAHRKARLGYCAQCGYPLADLPTAPDSCTVCPECGAAWRR